MYYTYVKTSLLRLICVLFFGFITIQCGWVFTIVCPFNITFLFKKKKGFLSLFCYSFSYVLLHFPINYVRQFLRMCNVYVFFFYFGLFTLFFFCVIFKISNSQHDFGMHRSLHSLASRHWRLENSRWYCIWLELVLWFVV